MPSTWSSVAPTTNGSGPSRRRGAADVEPATASAARAARISRDLRTASLSSLGTTSPLSLARPRLRMGHVDHLYRTSVLIGKQRRRETLGAEPDGIAAGRPVSSSAASIARRASSSSSFRVLRAMHATRAGRAISADPLVELDELAQRRDRVALVVVDVALSRLVAEHEHVRRAAVVEPERDARVLRMEQRALALDDQQLAAAAWPSTTSRSAAPAMKSATTASTEIPSRRSRCRLSRRHELGRDASPLRLAVELERDGHLPDRAVGADGQHDLAPAPRGSRRSARSGRAAACAGRAARRRARARARRARRRRSGTRAVRSRRRARSRCSSGSARGTPAGNGLPRSRRRRARSSDRSERLVHRADDREALLGLPRARGVEQRHDLLRRISHDAPRGLAVVRVAALALSED